MDLITTIPQVAQAAPKVIHHAAVHCKPLIKQGFTWASIYWPIISHSVAAAVGGGLAWYFKPKPAPVIITVPAPTPDPVVTDAPVV